MTLTNFFFLTSFTVIIPLIAALTKPGLLYKKNNWLLLYLILSVLTELCGMYYFLHSLNNLLIYSIYTVLEFPLLALAMLKGIRGTKKHPLIIILSTILLVAVIVQHKIKYLDGNNANALVTASELLLLIGFALYTLYRIMEDKAELYIQKSPRFWLATGVLTYAAGSFFFFLSTHYYSLANIPAPREYAILHSCFNFVFQITLTKSVLCYLNKTQAG